MEQQLALTVIPPVELVRQSTDIASLCRDIVIKCSLEIQKRKYVKVEGWQSIATAHGCVASSKDVERIAGGYRAIGEVRRMSDGFVIASAEGFVGEDEVTWFGGEQEFWNRETRKREKKLLPKRHDYAIRAMAQTRAISRACRSAFAHVVVLMDAGLSTTPAEEVPYGGFNDDNAIEERQERREQEGAQHGPTDLKSWREVECTFGKKNGPLRGKKLGDLNESNLKYLCEMFLVEGKEIKPADNKMVAALAMWQAEQKTPPATQDKFEKYNGPNHAKLAELLAWENPEIAQEHFLRAMKDAGQIPAEAKSFSGMSDETAKKFVDNFEDAKEIVRHFLRKEWSPAS